MKITRGNGYARENHVSLLKCPKCGNIVASADIDAHLPLFAYCHCDDEVKPNYNKIMNRIAKFKCGEEVYVLYHGRIHHAIVTKVEYASHAETFVYEFGGMNREFKETDNLIFFSIKDCIDYLTDNVKDEVS